MYITSYNENITALDKVVHRFDKYDLEAPTIVQTDQSYFALMSHKTGYRPNSGWPFIYTVLSQITLLTKCRCRCFPRRLTQRPMVLILYRRSPQHTNIQLPIRLLTSNKRHQKDHTPIPRRPMGLHFPLGVPLHLAPHRHQRAEKVPRSSLARHLRPQRLHGRSHTHNRHVLLQ